MRDVEIPSPAARSRRYRACEALPGLLSWLVLAVPLALLPLVSPGAVAAAG